MLRRILRILHWRFGVVDSSGDPPYTAVCFDLFCHDGARANDRVISNGHSLQNYRTPANPHIAANYNWFSSFYPA